MFYCAFPVSDARKFDTELNVAKLQELTVCQPSTCYLRIRVSVQVASADDNPSGSSWFIYSCIVPIQKPKEYLSKSLTYEDFRGIAMSPVLSKVFEY